MATPKFKLGRTVATPGALDALEKTTNLFSEFTTRHVCGDWGEVCKEDAALNDEAVANEGEMDKQHRVMSVYRLEDNTKIWIITEYNREVTTILLPSEY
jgi:hypothetical protein